MRFAISILLLFTGLCALAQTQSDGMQGLLEQGNSLVGENPAQAVKIGSHLLKIAHSPTVVFIVYTTV